MNLPKYFRLNKSIAFPLLTLIVCLLITYQAVNTAKIEVNQKKQAYFDFRVRDATNLINQRMQAYRQVLLGTAGLYKTSNNVERHEFKQYVETLDLAKNYPGIQGVGFSLIVPSSKKTQHIASIRSEGFPEYTIRPEGQRDIYTSIVYLEPFSERNLRAFGYDMFTEPVRHAAMQKAVDRGQTTLSGKVKLVQETGKQEQVGFLMYMPIYSNGTNNNTLSERREHIIGWVFAPFRINDLMDGLFGEHASDLDIHIFDGESMSAGVLMYDSDGSNLPNAEFSKTVHLQIADHLWTMHIRPLPKMSSRVETNHQALDAAIGIVISILISLLIWFLATGRERAINAAKRMNQELITERQRLSSIIEGTHVGTWEWNVQTGETRFNDHWANIIGYELSELEPISIETWMKFVHPDDAKISRELLEKHFSGELAYYECEARMQHKDGRWIWVLDRGKVTAWTEDGKPSLMAGTHQDITERKQLEASKQESLAHLQKIAHQVPGVVYQYRLQPDGHACFPFASEGIRTIYRVSPEEVREDATKIFNILHPEDLVGIVNSMEKSAQELTLWHHEYRVKFGDNTVRWLLGNAMPERESDGSVLWHGFIADITERKLMEEMLKVTEKKARAVMEASPLPFALNDEYGNITYLNTAFIQEIGYTLHEIPTLTEWWPKAYPDPTYRQWVEDIWQNNMQEAKLNKRPFIPLEINIQCKDTSVRTFMCSVAHLGGDFSATHLIIFFDITERKQAEFEVQRAREVAEHALLEQSRFMTMLTHEIKTPLSILRMSLGLVKAKVSLKQHINQALEDMNTIIERAVQVDLVEQRHLVVRLESCNIEHTLREMKSSGLAPDRLSIKMEPLPAVNSDSQLLRIILVNLINNAIKYSTPETEIELSAIPLEEYGKSGVLISIQNQPGTAGLPDPKQVFDKYYRSSGAYGMTGSGLGLYLVRSITDLLGGQVTYDVVQEKVRFTLWIPC